MKVSTLEKLFTIAALWDLSGGPRPRIKCREDEDCPEDQTVTSADFDDLWIIAKTRIHSEIEAMAIPLGGLWHVQTVLRRSAFDLAKQDTREGRRAARIMRKS